MKIIPLFLSALLVLAAAGRFHAEAQVRDSERVLANLQEERSTIEREIDQVRLDVEVLESAGRLQELNAAYLALGTVRAEQLLDDHEMAEMLGLQGVEKDSPLPANSDIIGNAIGMADLSMAEKVVRE